MVDVANLVNTGAAGKKIEAAPGLHLDDLITLDEKSAPRAMPRASGLGQDPQTQGRLPLVRLESRAGRPQKQRAAP